MNSTDERMGGGALIRARDDLAQAAETLSQMTARLGDTFNTASLRLLIPRLRQGLVRVAVIGATSSGKSALINALLKSLVVPENPNVSSPIPVWIGYQEGELKITVYMARDKNSEKIDPEECSVVKFQTEYCYNADHIKNRDTDQFSNVRYGAVDLESECLRGGMVLIDTLGISATDIDTAKTHAVLDEGVDLVLFVTKNNSFTQTEIDFLQTYVLGVHPEKRQVFHPVAPRNILFAVNPFGLNPQPVKAAVEGSIREAFALSALDPKELDAVLRNNVFYVHALKGRYGECGPYPYVERAPAGASERELNALHKKQDEEQKLLSNFGGDRLLLDSGVIPLRAGLQAHVRRHSYGADSAVVRRIRELSNLTQSVQLAASNRLSDTASVGAALEKTKAECSAQKESIEHEKRQINAALNQFKAKYISSLSQIYTATSDRMKNECVGYARCYPMPPAFNIRWNAFRQLSILEKQQYISTCFPELKDKIRQYCTDTVLTLMDINKPGQVLEQSRQFVQDASTSMSLRVRKLEQNGAQVIGVSLPTQETIDTLYGQLKSDLEEGISDAIKSSLTDAGHRFQKTMDSYIKSIKWGWLGMFDFLPHSQKAFWARVQSEVLVPLARQLVDEVVSIAAATDASQSDLALRVSGSYDHVEGKLRDNLTSLSTLVQLRIQEIEAKIATQTKETEDELAQYQGLKADCQELLQRLNSWGENFLNPSGD